MLARQHGVALITAMIITSIAVSIAAMMMYRQQIQIRLSSNINHLEQSYLYANGMEDWAGTILEKSFNDHEEYDSLQDDWYSDNGLILPITGGLMSGKLYDLQARINLNSIARPKPTVPTPPTGQPTPNPGSGTPVTPAKPPKPDVAEITRERIKNLITQIDPNQNMGTPEEFVDILKDWIDIDNINGNLLPAGSGSGYGAESPYYQSLESAYYSAGTELVSPTELRLLKNMNQDIYKELEKYTSVLPIEFNKNEIKTPVNVNTASEQVLRALGFDPQETKDIIDHREKNDPFEKIGDFTSLPFIAGAIDPNTGTVKTDDLDVKSSYFLLQGKVEINNTRLFINSILERKNGQLSVIMRDFSNPETITKAID